MLYNVPTPKPQWWLLNAALAFNGAAFGLMFYWS